MYKKKDCSQCERCAYDKMGENRCPLLDVCSTVNPKEYSKLTDYYQPKRVTKVLIKTELSKLEIKDFQTDSDLLDFAENHDFVPVDVEICLSELKTKGTPCENCAFITSRLSYSPCYPCSQCTRMAKDFFVDNNVPVNLMMAKKRKEVIEDYLCNKTNLTDLEEFLGYQVNDEVIETLAERIAAILTIMSEDEQQEWYAKIKGKEA